MSASTLYNLPFTDITADVTTFVFTDGLGVTLTPGNSPPGYYSFDLATDSNGIPTSWHLNSNSFPTDLGAETCNDAPACALDSTEILPIGGINPDEGSNYSDPGTWTVTTTPLPAALPLFATGLGALGLFGWRRKPKTAAAVAA